MNPEPGKHEGPTINPTTQASEANQCANIQPMPKCYKRPPTPTPDTKQTGVYMVSEGRQRTRARGPSGIKHMPTCKIVPTTQANIQPCIKTSPQDFAVGPLPPALTLK